LLCVALLCLTIHTIQSVNETINKVSTSATTTANKGKEVVTDFWKSIEATYTEYQKKINDKKEALSKQEFIEAFKKNMGTK
jgi:hypothetical protein